MTENALQKRRKAWILCLTVLCALAIVVILRREPGEGPSQDSSPPSTSSPDDETALQTLGAEAFSPASSSSPTNLLDEAFQELSAEPDLLAKQALLDELERILRAQTADKASASIRQFLSRKQDADTGQRWKLTLDHRLQIRPTFRVALLDLWGALDPAEASAYAEAEIFNGFDSADEWAIGLRNYVWKREESDRERIVELSQQLLTHETWLDHPTDGFLEAFDLMLHFREPWCYTLMTKINAEPDRAEGIGWASFLALDRMMIQSPVVMAEWMLHNEDARGMVPQTRAQLFARLDVRNDNQRRVLETYLSRPLTAEESQTFMGQFPQHGLAVSPRLLTPMQTGFRTLQQIVRMDQASHLWVEEAQSEGRWSSAVMDHLPLLQERLAQFQETLDLAISRGEFTLE